MSDLTSSGGTPGAPPLATPPSRLPSALDLVVEQLWQPALDAGLARATIDADVDPRWQDTERYRILPGPGRPRLLIPAAGRRVMARSLTNYRGLRPQRVNAQRTVLGMSLRAGLPVGRHTLAVQHRVGVDGGEGLPVEALSRALGRRQLHASIGVRTGANRKATLQLVDGAGDPVGFAKFGWDEATSEFVRTESAALLELGSGRGRMRAPELLTSGTWWGRPYLVTAPLPLSCRGLRADAPPPTPLELSELCPLSRSATVSTTAQFQSLRTRLEATVTTATSAALAARALALVHRLAALEEVLPVSQRWHGDLTPWNSARDEHGTLWCWDWESSERDVVAGLDSIHWALSVRREQGVSVDGATLLASVADAREHLIAFGLGGRARAVAAALYAAAVVERACTLARGAGGWTSLWIQPGQLEDMLDAAHGLLDRHLEPT